MLTQKEEKAIERLKKAFDAMPKTLRIYATESSVVVCKVGVSCYDFEETLSYDINPCACVSDMHDDMDFGKG